jgi:hypothetical protein
MKEKAGSSAFALGAAHRLCSFYAAKRRWNK